MPISSGAKGNFCMNHAKKMDNGEEGTQSRLHLPEV